MTPCAVSSMTFHTDASVSNNNPLLRVILLTSPEDDLDSLGWEEEWHDLHNQAENLITKRRYFEHRE